MSNIRPRLRTFVCLVPMNFPRVISNARHIALLFTGDRGRSVSPSFEYYQNRSLRGFTSAANRKFANEFCALIVLDKHHKRPPRMQHLAINDHLTRRSHAYYLCAIEILLIFLSGCLQILFFQHIASLLEIPQFVKYHFTSS